MIIGITGSSGAGKTTVCTILKQDYNFKTVIADEIARKLSKKGTNYSKDIVKNFGQDILLKNGELDRKKIANIIYDNEEKRKKLNDCTFKYIVKEIKNEIVNGNNSNIAIDAPLLFEANLDKICDTTIAVVDDNIEEQIKRIIKRDKIDREKAISRIKAQQTNEFYIKNCDYKILNNNNLKQQIEIILQDLQNR